MAGAPLEPAPAEELENGPPGAVAVVEAAPPWSCVNGLRARPVNRELPEDVDTLTAGNAVPGGAAEPVAGSWLTLVGAEELLESSTGTATSAASSSRAIGHSRFSRRSESMPLMSFIARTG